MDLENTHGITETDGTISDINMASYSAPEMVYVIEKSDCIEIVYKQTALTSFTVGWDYKPPEERVFKIVFSCKNGKWHKSDRIYGEIVPAKEEQYVFEASSDGPSGSDGPNGNSTNYGDFRDPQNFESQDEYFGRK